VASPEEAEQAVTDAAEAAEELQADAAMEEAAVVEAAASEAIADVAAVDPIKARNTADLPDAAAAFSVQAQLDTAETAANAIAEGAGAVVTESADASTDAMTDTEDAAAVATEVEDAVEESVDTSTEGAAAVTGAAAGAAAGAVAGATTAPQNEESAAEETAEAVDQDEPEMTTEAAVEAAGAADDRPRTGAPIDIVNVQRVHAFLDRLEGNDIDAFMTLWADDGEQVMPYAPENYTRQLVGLDQIREQYEQLPELYDRQRYVDRRIRATRNPNVVHARFRGEIKLVDSGKNYNNEYVGIFEFNNDGKLVRYTEYFNPTVLLETFGPATKP